MLRKSAKMSALLALAIMPIVPAKANELSIALRATIEPRCQLVNIARAPAGQSSDLRVTVSCNAAEYQLRLVGSDGPVMVTLNAASASAGLTSVAGNAVFVSARSPGLHVFDLQLPEGRAQDALLMIQLDGV